MQVAGGVDHTCALNSTGAAECWGTDGSGGAVTATKSPTVGVFTQISAHNGARGVGSDGTIEC